MFTIPMVSQVQARGKLSQYAIEWQPTRKIAVATLMGDIPIERVAEKRPSFTSGLIPDALWRIPPPTPQTGPLTDEQFDRLRHYMAINLHSGFATTEVLRQAQVFAEAMVKEQTYATFPLQTGQLEYIAMLIRQVAEALAITPEQVIEAKR